MNPTDKLYDFLAANNMIDPNRVSKEKFMAGLDEKKARTIYNSLDAKHRDGTEEEFVSALFPKKKVESTPYSDTLPAPSPAPGPMSSGSEKDVLIAAGNGIAQDVLMSAPEPNPFRKPNFTPVTGQEDPFTYSADPKTKESASAFAGEDVSRDKPEFSSAKYSRDAELQARIAKENLEMKYGKDWRVSAPADDPMRKSLEMADVAKKKGVDAFNIATGAMDVNGDTDPIQFGENRKLKLPDADKRKQYDSRNGLREEKRKVSNIKDFAKAAQLKYDVYSGVLTDKFGDWQSIVENTNEQSAPEIVAAYNEIVGSEEFGKIKEAIDASQKGQAAFKSIIEGNGEYAKRILMERTAQSMADAYKDGTPELFGLFVPGNRQGQSWAKRKSAQILSSALSLPRTIGEGVFGSSNTWTVADELGSLADELASFSEAKYPKPTMLSRPAYERIVNVGDLEIAVVNGKPVKAYNKDGDAVDLPKDISIDPSKAVLKFNGVSNVTDKVADSAADLFAYRGIGGGNKVGTLASSFFMGHSAAYREAQDAGMSSEDASEYAMVSSLLQGAIEAYIGDIETKLASPTIKAAKQLAVKDAMTMLGKETPTQIALAAVKPVIKQVAEENAEEMIASITDSVTKAAYKDMTGVDMGGALDAASIKETILVTTLLTTPMAALGMGANVAASKASAVLAATNNPVKFSEIAMGLAEKGLISADDAQAQSTIVNKLAEFKTNLPKNIDDNAIGHLMSLEYQRMLAEGAAKDPSIMPAQQKEASDSVKEIVEAQREVITEGSVSDGELQVDMPQEEPAAALQETPAQTPEAQPISQPQTTDQNVGQESVLPSPSEQPAEPGQDKGAESAAKTESIVSRLDQVMDVDDATSEEIKAMVEDGLPEEDIVQTVQEDAIQDEPQASTPRDAVHSFFSGGGRISTKNAGNKRPGRFFSDDGESIETVSARVAKQAGISVDDARQEIKSYISKPPIVSRAKAKSEVKAAISAKSDATPEEISAAVEEADEEIDTINENDIIAISRLFEAMDNDQGRVYAALRGEGSPEDVDVANRFKSQNNIAYDLIKEESGASPSDTVGEEVVPEDKAAGAGKPGMGKRGGGEPAADGGTAVKKVASKSAKKTALKRGASPKEVIPAPKGAEVALPMTEEQAVDAMDAKNDSLRIERKGVSFLSISDSDAIVERPIGNEWAIREVGGSFNPEHGWIIPKAAIPAFVKKVTTSAPKMSAQAEIGAGDQGRSSLAQMNAAIDGAETIDDMVDAARFTLGSDALDEKTTEVLDRLTKSFPGVTVVTDSAVIAEKLSSLGVKEPVVAFVHEGVVYLDAERAGIEAVMHEFGHIWAEMAKVHRPALYAQGIEAMRGSEYEAMVREDESYSFLESDEEVLSEALAKAIGARGVHIADGERWGVFKRVLSGIWNMAKSIYGFDPKKMKAREFADRVAADMLKGDIPARTISRKGKVEFMFGGENSTKVDALRQALDSAKMMHMNGVSNRDIWTATGWFIGHDGMWRYEIGDSEASLNIVPSLMSGTEAMYLDDAMSHKGLFEAYPGIAKLPVVFSKEDLPFSASLANNNGRYYVIVNANRSDSDIVSSLIHEAQHVIQLEEGFAFGVDFSTLPDLLTSNLTSAIAERDVERMRHLVEAAKLSSREIYQRASGEVEARNAEARMSGDTSFPHDTEDVAPEEQIVLFGTENGASEMPGFRHVGASFQFGSQKVRDEAIDSAVRRISKIAIDKSEPKDVSVAKIAQGLGISEKRVSDLWDDEASKAGAPKYFMDKAKEALDEMKSRVKKSYDKWVSPYRGLPRDAFKAMQEQERRLNTIMYQAERATSDLKDALKGFDKSMGTMVNAVLNGHANIDVLPDELIAPTMRIRATIDALSRQLLVSGAIPKGTVMTVIEGIGVDIDEDTVDALSIAFAKPPFARTDEDNDMIDEFFAQNADTIGSYMNRSYRAHNDTDWINSVPKAEYDAAVVFTINRLNERREKAIEAANKKKGVIERRIEKIKNSMKSVASVANGLAGPDNEDIAKQINEDVRQLTGEGDLPAIELPGAEALSMDALASTFRALSEKMAKSIEELDTLQEKADAKIEDLDYRIKNADEEVMAYLYDQVAPTALIRSSMAGEKDMRILKQRKDVPPEIRALLGEYTDPEITTMTSVMKMANLLTQQDFLNTIATKFKGVYFFDGPDKPAGNYAQVSSNGDPALSPIDGMYTTPEILEALQAVRTPREESWIFRTFAAAIANNVKLGKTILSPITHARNIWGNTAFMVLNGWNPISAIDALKQTSESLNGSMDARRAYYSRLYELGVLGESVSAADITNLRDRSKFFIEANGFEHGLHFLLRPLGNVFDAAKTAYEWEDNFFRIAAFENEKRRYASAYYDKQFVDLSVEEKAKVEERAAYIVSHIMPTYSLVPNIVREIRAIPLVGTFVAFPAEMFRVGYNNVQLGLDELKDKRTAAMGIKRLAGAALIHSLEIGAIGAAMAAFGYDEDEMNDMRLFVAEFEKNGALLPLPKDEDGNIGYINLSYTNPYGFLGKIARSVIYEEGTPVEAVVSGMKEATSPFLTPELSLYAFTQLMMNQDDWGNDIRKDAFKDVFGGTWFSKENLIAQGNFMRKKLQPGLSKSIIDAWDIQHKNVSRSGKIKNWSNFALSHIFGLSVQRVDPSVSFAAQSFKLAKNKAQARSLYTSAQRRWNTDIDQTLKGGDAEVLSAHKSRAIADLKNQYEMAKESYVGILEDMNRLTKAYIRMGKSEKEALDALDGFNDKEKRYILRGGPAPFLKFEKKKTF